jgi:tetratricopeptide (TPR) repeat protein
MKKRTRSIAFALLLLLSVGATAAAREDFAAANRLYEQGRYAEALPVYLKVADQFPSGRGGAATDWQVPYNIANCHYKLGNYLQAKVHYLKARRLRPLEPAVARNIAMTNRHFLDDARLPDPDFVTRAVQMLESRVSLDALSVMLLLAALLFNAFLFLLLTRGRSRKLLYALGFSLLLVAGLGACHVGRAAALGRSDTAVIREEGSPLRSGPGEDHTVLFKVNPGLEVRIIDRSGEWVQVTASERIAGWIETKRLVLI